MLLHRTDSTISIVLVYTGRFTATMSLTVFLLPAIMVGSIDPDGSILCCELVEESIMVRNESLSFQALVSFIIGTLRSYSQLI